MIGRLSARGAQTAAESRSRGVPGAVLAGSIAILVMISNSSPASAQECASGAVFSGPITITSGGIYTGNWQSVNPSIPAVQIFTTQPVTIINSRVRGPGDLILAGSRSNLTIRESCFVGTTPSVAGTAKGSALHAFESANVIVEHCDFDAVGLYGVWVQKYLGDFTASNSIAIRYNRFHNIDGRYSQYSHAIILSNALAVPGVEIAWNQIVNEPYQSQVEDSINIYDSSGTRASPMQLHDNYIQGGWKIDPTTDDAASYTGSAFTTDGLFQTDPNLTTSFLKIHDNQAVAFGSLGLGIAVGHDIEMYSNRVISSGQLANGANDTTSYATGIAHNNGYRNNPPGVFGNNSVHDNVSGVRRQRNGQWERFDYYFGAPPAINSNNANFTPATASFPTFADEANELLRWSQKLSSQGLTVGSHFVVGALVPGAPGSLTASASGSTVSLVWTAPASGFAPTTYYIEAGSAPGAADLANFPTGTLVTTFTATSVGAGTYYVRVRAANPIGKGPASPDATLRVGGSCSAQPSPAGLTNSVVGSTVTLTWSPSSGAASYVLEAGSASGASNLAVLDTGNANAMFVASGVGAGTYFVRIRATNLCGTSGPSNETIVRVQ